jgi:hypothetical protein
MTGSEYSKVKLKSSYIQTIIWGIELSDVDPRRRPMERHLPEVVGVRRTGWAALDRDPQQDVVEFTCPHCGAKSQKKARRERAEYRFTDGFLQDLQGEGVQCHLCKQSLRIVPVVMLHDQDEAKRFAAVFSDEPLVHAE